MLGPVLSYYESGLKTKTGRPRVDAGFGLTQRQLLLVRRIAHGLSNKAIAEELSVSTKTIEKHRECLMKKLDFRFKQQCGTVLITHFALANGLVKNIFSKQ